MNHKFIIIVPFYNEKDTIEEVAKNLVNTGHSLLFVNDGSIDCSNSLLERLQETIGGFDIVSYTPNQGKGFAIKTGVKEAIYMGYEWFLFMDSDNQFAIDDMDKFITLAEGDKEAKIIIGNRLFNPIGMPKIRYITNKVMSWIISLFSKQYIIDSQCGYRMCHKDVFEHKLVENGFGMETEMLIKAGKKGYKIVNCPVKCIYNKNRVSKINPIKDTFRFIRLLFKLF